MISGKLYQWKSFGTGPVWESPERKYLLGDLQPGEIVIYLGEEVVQRSLGVKVVFRDTVGYLFFSGSISNLESLWFQEAVSTD